MKKLHFFGKQKKRGSLEDLLIMMIFMAVAAVIIVLYLNLNVAINNKNKLNSIAREYLLKMESDGYLTNTIGGANEMQNLIDALNDAGYTKDGIAPVDSSCIKGTVTALGNSYTNNTTTSDLGYGEEIQLDITVCCETFFEMGKGSSDFIPMFKKSNAVMTIHLTTTSKE